jgi:hypothetical protein
MSFDKQEEKECPQDVQSVYAAAIKVVETLAGKITTRPPENSQVTPRFPKTILKNTLGERTYLIYAVGAQGDGGQVEVDAYPLDALEPKLIFGVRKGVTRTGGTWIIADRKNHLRRAAR